MNVITILLSALALLISAGTLWLGIKTEERTSTIEKEKVSIEQVARASPLFVEFIRAYSAYKDSLEGSEPNKLSERNGKWHDSLLQIKGYVDDSVYKCADSLRSEYVNYADSEKRKRPIRQP